jgi:hypothetical protein
MHSAASPDNDRQRPGVLRLLGFFPNALPRISRVSAVSPLCNPAKDRDLGAQQ